MRTRVVVGMLVLAAAGMVPACAAGAGDVGFLFAVRKLPSEWKPIDLQAEGGVLTNWGGISWPVRIEADLRAAFDDEDANSPFSNFTLRSASAELDLGVRKSWGHGRSHPYVAGGLAVLRSETRLDGPGFPATTIKDTGTGFFAGGGILWRLGPTFNLGIDVRYARIPVETWDQRGPSGFGASIERRKLDQGGISGGLVIGWGWPAHRG